MRAPPRLAPHSLVLDALAGRRGERVLFENLTLTLRPGEGAELRGPNGVGKTTLLLVVAGILRPAAGRVRLDGGDPEARPETAIGYLGHRAALKGRLTVTENLRFWAALNGGTADAIAAALEVVGLGGIAGLDAGLLSAGQSKRLALARLLVSERPVWLLDEPVAALDAEGEALVGRLLDAHLERGGIVLAATHQTLATTQPLRRVELQPLPVRALEGVW